MRKFDLMVPERPRTHFQMCVSFWLREWWTELNSLEQRQELHYCWDYNGTNSLRLGQMASNDFGCEF